VLDGGFAKALEKLKPGESALVETEYGVHVVRLLKMAPRVRPSFEDIKPLMLVEAEKTYRQRFLQDYLTKIKSDPTIKVHTEVLDQIRPKLPEIPPPATAATR
jgi:parvulin-like peptidyl-prolyl isomerase